MLTKKYRPQSFKTMFGANLSRQLLKTIAKDPTNKPTSLVLSGQFGCGKTTASRIFAKAINCSFANGDACNKCESCQEIDKGSSLYQEYDSSMVGNVDKIRELRDLLSYSLVDGYRVVVFDESHLISKQAMSSLLKVLEESPSQIFFLFVTTNLEKMLDTIKSRSLVLDFPTLEHEELEGLLDYVCKHEDLTLSDNAVQTLCRRCNGHARDLLGELDKLRILSEESYLDNVVLLDTLFKQMFMHSIKGDTEKAKETLQTIMGNSLYYIQNDFDEFVIKLADEVFIFGKNNKKAKELVKFYIAHRQYLTNTNTWYAFFCMVIDMFVKKRGE